MIRFRVVTDLKIDVDEWARIRGISAGDAFKEISKWLRSHDYGKGQTTVTQTAISVSLPDLFGPGVAPNVIVHAPGV